MTDYETNLFGEKVPLLVADGDDVVSEKVAYNPYNVFAFTDAIAARNKKDAWVLYQKAIASGMVPEELFFKVVWQIKTLLIASRTSNVSETEMKDYPYQKAKAAQKNFKPGELEQLSINLVVGYHEARRGKGEIGTLIEKMLLRL